jgi:hypothetical protein
VISNKLFISDYPIQRQL